MTGIYMKRNALLKWVERKRDRQTETVTRRCSVKKLFLKNSQNSQENTCAGVSFLVKSLFFKSLNFIKKNSGAGVFL